MILLADSGSSKTDWRILHKDGQVSHYRGIGFNPYYMSPEEMAKQLRQDFLLAHAQEIQQIFYYGAGCAAPERQKDVASALRSIFEKASIQVNHDLLAAAKATCGKEAGIACILGTGSNSCDYDGQVILRSRPAPGYILGDEGGGCDVGRQFLQDFIHEEMPDYLRKMAMDRFQLSQNGIQDQVYRQPYPNRYMASFCRFITENKSDPYCFALFYNSFQRFFAKHVCKYPAYQKKTTHFVGSIAYYNEDMLRKAASDLEIQVGRILESPIEGLTQYHQEML